jgi:hypothetical protein
METGNAREKEVDRFSADSGVTLALSAAGGQRCAQFLQRYTQEVKMKDLSSRDIILDLVLSIGTIGAIFVFGLAALPQVQVLP